MKMEKLEFELAFGYVSFGPFAFPPPVEASSLCWKVGGRMHRGIYHEKQVV